MQSNAPSSHSWHFFRTGGLEQVSLESAADLLALEQLDQELWVALSCPVKGLALDEKTLALIDSDGDGRIGVPDVVAAVKWACARVKDPGELLRGSASLPLTAINDDAAEGKVLLASARRILSSVGRTDAGEITVAEASDSARVFAASPINGDGIIPPEATDDPAVQGLIKDIIGCGGGTARKSGVVGVTAASIDKFFAELAPFVTWSEKSLTKEIAVLGPDTGMACAALKAVRAKVEDYFARTRLAAFDTRATAALNRNEAEYLAIAGRDMKLSAEELRGFPLARIEAGRPLPLLESVNPAWAGALAELHEKVVTPIFGEDKTSLTAAEWNALNARFAEYETCLAARANGSVEKVGLDRIKGILAGDGRAALAELVARDKALQPEFSAIGEVERLTRYYRDLRTLLHNFVNFADFYSRDRYAIFQAGTLYLDSRSTELCFRIDAVSPLAAMSKAYIAYCNCTPAGGGAPMVIAACFTQGDSDYLFVGRNGVFYDRKGKLWYAVITSIVDAPISIRQAFWAPYKKFLRFIEEQVAKRAAAADAAASGKLAGAAEKVATADQAKPPAPGAPAQPKKFDLALITGIGVALGSIGGFMAAVFANVVRLPGWQIPLIFVGLILVISLPSMFIAALKLRQRTMAPILEATGWAINGRVKINIPFGAALTHVAKLPPGSKRSLEDPYEDKEATRRRRLWTVIIVIVGLISAAFWIRWDHDRRGGLYFWQHAPAAPTPPVSPK